MLKNRPHDLTIDRTGRMFYCSHRGQEVGLTLKTALTLTLYFYNTLLASSVRTMAKTLKA